MLTAGFMRLSFNVFDTHLRVYGSSRDDCYSDMVTHMPSDLELRLDQSVVIIKDEVLNGI